jgi:hypothetical protein
MREHRAYRCGNALAHITDDGEWVSIRLLDVLEERNELLGAFRRDLAVVQHDLGDSVEHTDQVRTRPLTGPVEVKDIAAVDSQMGSCFRLYRAVKHAQIHDKLPGEKRDLAFTHPDISLLQRKANLTVVARAQEHALADKRDDVIAEATVFGEESAKLMRAIDLPAPRTGAHRFMSDELSDRQGSRSPEHSRFQHRQRFMTLGADARFRLEVYQRRGREEPLAGDTGEQVVDDPSQQCYDFIFRFFLSIRYR